MESFGKWLQDVGFAILPYSFIAYFPLRWLEYIRQKGPSRLIKGIWYFALGTLYWTGDVQVNLVVMYICFIEAWDLAFQQLELKRAEKGIVKTTGQKVISYEQKKENQKRSSESSAEFKHL